MDRKKLEEKLEELNEIIRNLNNSRHNPHTSWKTTQEIILK
jgi:hypothetical protein